MDRDEARQKIMDQLIFLVGPNEANELLDDFEKSILTETNFYTLRDKYLNEFKNKLIEEIEPRMLMSCPTFKETEIYVGNGMRRVSVERREQVDKVEVIKLIKNFELKDDEK